MGDEQQVWFRLVGGPSDGYSGSMQVSTVGGWLLAAPPMLCAPGLGNGWYRLGRVVNGTMEYLWKGGYPDAAD